MTHREEQLLRWIEKNPMISQQELADKAGITRSSVAVHISNLMKKGYISGKGYVLTQSAAGVVVGGVNMDIGGLPINNLVTHDSNPGRVRMSLGGVGRNIAHNMSLLGVNTQLITAFGNDMSANKIAASCNELGIDISNSLKVPDGTTSTYLFISNERGDMELAVSDMEIYERMTPDFLMKKMNVIAGAKIVVTDTNIPADTIACLAKHSAAPIFADPVSTTKAIKLKPVLGQLHTLKPNLIEAELLSGVPISDEESLKKAAEALLATGLNRVFISLGSDGVFAAERERCIHLPCFKGKMVNTTGCGDAFMAALAWSFLEDMDLEQSARAGLAASVIAMEGDETINPEMSAKALRMRADLQI